MKTYRTKEVLTRVDNYLRLMRFKYTDLEKLSRLQILDDYYNTKKEEANTEVFKVKIECAEQLANGKLIMPLKVRGIFLTEGRPFKKFYTAATLENSVGNPVNQKFPLMLDHKRKEAGKIIGMVDTIKFDPVIEGLRWWGHINDETFARNVMDGSITEVSVTVFSVSIHTPEHGLEGVDLTFKELSLVLDGLEPDNLIEVDT